MRWTLTLVFLLAISAIHAQIGGNNVYEFLNLPQSPRVTALGGSLITVLDDDIALAYTNPATLNEGMHEQMTFNTEFYFKGTGIKHGYVGYGHYLEKANLSLHGGIQFISYGSFDGYDEYANNMGTFKSGEYAITVGVGRQLSEKLSAGANLRAITSRLEGYNSFGMATDLAMMYKDTASRFTASLVLKNAGLQFSTYAGRREAVPFEIQAGFSKRLKHLPFRISITGIQLQRWNILYDDPNQTDELLLFGEQPKETSKAQLFVDNFFRHFVFSGEFLFGKKENFRMRLGYNHLRRAELSLDNIRSMAGMSLGTGFKIKQFRIDYGLAFYHVGGTVHHLGISTGLGEFR